MKIPHWITDLLTWIFWVLLALCGVACLAQGCERLLFP